MNKILKNLSVIIIFLSVSLYSNAQVGESRNDLAIGFNGGVNMSSVSFTPTIKQSNIMGMCGGLSIRYTCEKYFYCDLWLAGRNQLCTTWMEGRY